MVLIRLSYRQIWSGRPPRTPDRVRADIRTSTLDRECGQENRRHVQRRSLSSVFLQGLSSWHSLSRYLSIKTASNHIIRSMKIMQQTRAFILRDRSSICRWT